MFIAKMCENSRHTTQKQHINIILVYCYYLFLCKQRAMIGVVTEDQLVWNKRTGTL